MGYVCFALAFQTSIWFRGSVGHICHAVTRFIPGIAVADGERLRCAMGSGRNHLFCKIVHYATRALLLKLDESATRQKRDAFENECVEVGWWLYVHSIGQGSNCK